MKEVIEELGRILSDAGFTKVSETLDKACFGNVIVNYKIKNALARIVSDRSIVFLDIAIKPDLDKWLDLQIFKAFLENTDFREDFLISENLEWLKNNIKTIQEKLSDENYCNTRKTINSMICN